MASTFASCIMWIVCSQAITSTHHNAKSNCNSTTLLSSDPDVNYINDNAYSFVALIDCHKTCYLSSFAQFSSLFSKTPAQKHVESDAQVNEISYDMVFEHKTINNTTPFLPLSSKIEKWADSIDADVIKITNNTP
eukprot:772977_1